MDLANAQYLDIQFAASPTRNLHCAAGAINERSSMESKEEKPSSEKPKIEDLEPKTDAKAGATVVTQERTSAFFHS